MPRATEPAAVNQRKIERVKTKIAELNSELEVLTEAAAIYTRLPTRRRRRTPTLPRGRRGRRPART